MRVVVVGAGVFGAAAARELAARHEVTVVDPGVADGEPAPLAESTDISKVVRLDYGTDLGYLGWMEEALAGWRAWQGRWAEPLFHETGVMFLSRRPLDQGGFEADNVRSLASRGHRIEVLGGADVRRRFPAWNAEAYPAGYYNPQGGYAESGRVVATLLAEARALGAALVTVGVTAVEGRTVRLVGGGTLGADVVLVAAGAWTQEVLPELGGELRATGQPVFHLRPAAPERFRAEVFPVFGADISTTGWYGFPLSRSGVVKVANHGVGRPVAPGQARATDEAEERHLRRFLAETFPELATAPVVYRRQCVYGDTRDQHFWIDHHPDRPGVVVAAGGSGHGFKFAPLLGRWIADVVEGGLAPARFRWRQQGGAGEEEARAGEAGGGGPGR